MFPVKYELRPKKDLNIMLDYKVDYQSLSDIDHKYPCFDILKAINLNLPLKYEKCHGAR